MDVLMYYPIYLMAFVASALTLLSGFGLGTMLMPVFIIFFPAPVAVALTAIVHLVNNLMKFVLLGKHADMKIVKGFGLYAIPAAFVGASILILLGEMPVIWQVQMGGIHIQFTPVKFMMGLLILLLVILETNPWFNGHVFQPKHMAMAGLLSGFLGGLSGHQGALRSAYLSKCALTKEQFIATGVVIACLVDIARLIIYAPRLMVIDMAAHGGVMILSIGSSLAGVYVMSRWVKKITMAVIQQIVSIMLVVIALLLILGLV